MLLLNSAVQMTLCCQIYHQDITCVLQVNISSPQTDGLACLMQGADYSTFAYFIV